MRPIICKVFFSFFLQKGQAQTPSTFTFVKIPNLGISNLQNFNILILKVKISNVSKILKVCKNRMLPEMEVRKMETYENEISKFDCPQLF
jgi:hypothetical protein